jgi:hypothetical protein
VHRGHLADALGVVAQEHEAPVAELAGQESRDLDHHHLGVERAVHDVADARDHRVAQAGDALARAAARDPERDRGSHGHAGDAREVLLDVEEDVVRDADEERQAERIRADPRRGAYGRAERRQERARDQEPDEERILAPDRVDERDHAGDDHPDGGPDPTQAPVARPAGHIWRHRRSGTPRTVGRSHLLLSGPAFSASPAAPSGGCWSL